MTLSVSKPNSELYGLTVREEIERRPSPEGQDGRLPVAAITDLSS